MERITVQDQADSGRPRGALDAARAAYAVVVSGPSGVGKTSICEGVLRQDPTIRPCVTTTTRPMRPGEVDGEDYHFVSEQAFREGLARGEFVEWAEVYDYRYGATVDAASQALSGGGAMLLDVDVQGAETWKRALEDQCVTVFVLPPSIELLRSRLEGRRTEEARALQRRMDNARKELARADGYDYVIVNDDLATAICDLRAIVRAERQRSWRMASFLGCGAEPCGLGSTT